MRPVETWVEKRGEELVRGWKELKRKASDDLAQSAVCGVLKRKPAGRVVPYLNKVAFLNRIQWEDDGKQWVRRRCDGRKFSQMEKPGGLLLEGDKSLGEVLMGHYPSPERQIEARQLLRLADPRLVQAAYNSNYDGTLGKVPGVSYQTLSVLRHQFFIKVGERYRGVDGRRQRDAHELAAIKRRSVAVPEPLEKAV